MMAAANLQNGATLSLLLFPEKACCIQCVYQISSKSVDKWPKGSISLIFKMATAANLGNGGTLPLRRFLNSACFL
jgi:hypothetical protein